MSTLIGTAAATDILGVTPATLYAYVSRGKIDRQSGPDGRTSLYRRDDIEALAARSRNAPRGVRPSIDVRIDSSITKLDERGVTIRGHDLPDLVNSHSYEAIAELLWHDKIEHDTWPTPRPADRKIVDDIVRLSTPDSADRGAVGRMAMLAHALDREGDGAPTAARRLLVAIPSLLGSTRHNGRYAHRLASAWVRRPSATLVDSVDRALGLLADHELATSTLAVRVAASVRSSPYAAIAAGLATVQGPLHGAAADGAHHFLLECGADGVTATVRRFKGAGRRFPGFGHKIYRGPDPRFAVLRSTIADTTLLDEVVAEVGRIAPVHPNIDLALGALTVSADLPGPVPIFAVARIAGWAAHYAEELEAAPVRYRGIAN